MIKGYINQNYSKWFDYGDRLETHPLHAAARVGCAEVAERLLVSGNLIAVKNNVRHVIDNSQYVNMFNLKLSFHHACAHVCQSDDYNGEGNPFNLT